LEIKEKELKEARLEIKEKNKTVQKLQHQLDQLTKK
jgi:hypothetical protein